MTYPTEATDQRVAQIAARAQELFTSKEMLCSEAIAVALHEAMDTGLSEETVRGMAAAYPQGLGNAGCVCGALNGGALMLGLYLSSVMPPVKVREASRRLHDEFKSQCGSTCCRVLTKKVKDDPKAHFAQCGAYTGLGAKLASRMILSAVPELAKGDKLSSIAKPFPRLGRFLRRISRILG